MNFFTKAQMLAHIARWRVTWAMHSLDYKPKGVKNPKFITAREAATKFYNGAVVFSSGMAANARCSIFFWGLRDLFEKTDSPKGLTWIVVGAQGSRGRVPGTLEELNHPGLITKLIGGHLETVKAQLRMADDKTLELHTLPQGIEAFLLEAQARGETTVESHAGVGTFLDPRVGSGSYVGGLPQTESFVEAAGDKLRYRMPQVDIAIFVAPYADEEGNIYKTHTATMTESYESALATKKNGGTVIVSVGQIVPKDETNIFLPADKVDFIVVNRDSEQTGSVKQHRYWPMFTVEHHVDTHDAVEKLWFVNNVLKITPVRTQAEMAVGRLAASLFTKICPKGAMVNIGVGLPEEVSRLVYEGGLHEEIQFFTETGVLGGLPAPGIFFGAAVNPEKIITSAQIFRLAYEKMDTTVLGILEVDSDGNVNVSKRGPRCLDYVGPGGFPNLVDAANNIIFAGSWMAHAKIELIDGQMAITKPGEHKFRERVSEITFSGAEALKQGKNVFYATNVGLFRLTEKGVMLVQVMPGIDIERDILQACPMKVVLPESGLVPVVPPDIVTGEGFELNWTT
jgi:propionate CoA-transferase